MSEVANSTRAEYLSHIEKQKLTNLSISEYCVQNNLDEQKFGYYKSYKLKSSSPKPQIFVKAKVKQDSVQSAPTPTVRIDPVWLAQFINNLLVTRK